jgi:Family of unknown function (DUF5723)
LPIISNFGLSVYNTGFALNDLFIQRGDTAVLKLSNIANVLKKENHIGITANTSLFAFQINAKKLSVGFSLNERADVKLTYPGELAKFIINGNGATLGQAQNIGGFKLNANYYHEFALHFQKQFGRLVIGASPKLLFGQANIHTIKSNLSLLTDTSYFNIAAESEMEIATSGIDTSMFGSNGSSLNQLIFNPKNMGLGLNIGATYFYKDKWQFSAGINDIGYLKWTDKLKTYSSPNVKLNFEGVNFNQLIGKDSFGITKIIDSITNLFQLTESNNAAYRVGLPTQFYIMANYKLSKAHAIGATLTASSFNKNVIPTFTACYQFTPNRRFNAALSYTAKPNAAFNLGAALMLKGLGTQWYILSDNMFNAFNPLSAKNANISFGVNIAIGKFQSSPFPKSTKKPKPKADADNTNNQPSKKEEPSNK